MTRRIGAATIGVFVALSCSLPVSAQGWENSELRGPVAASADADKATATKQEQDKTTQTGEGCDSTKAKEGGEKKSDAGDAGKSAADDKSGSGNTNAGGGSDSKPADDGDKAPDKSSANPKSKTYIRFCLDEAAPGEGAPTATKKAKKTRTAAHTSKLKLALKNKANKSKAAEAATPDDAQKLAAKDGAATDTSKSADKEAAEDTEKVAAADKDAGKEASDDSKSDAKAAAKKPPAVAKTTKEKKAKPEKTAKAPKPAKTPGKKSSSSDVAWPARIASTVVGTFGGMPIAVGRKVYSETISGAKDLVGENTNWFFLIPAGALSVPFAAVSAGLQGPVWSAWNAWKGSADEPFSKDTFSLGDMD